MQIECDSGKKNTKGDSQKKSKITNIPYRLAALKKLLLYRICKMKKSKIYSSLMDYLTILFLPWKGNVRNIAQNLSMQGLGKLKRHKKILKEHYGKGYRDNI